MPPTSIRCPACGHALLTIDLPQIPHAQALTPTPRAQADAPLLLRIPEAARLLGVSRSRAEGGRRTGISSSPPEAVTHSAAMSNTSSAVRWPVDW